MRLKMLGVSFSQPARYKVCYAVVMVILISSILYSTTRNGSSSTEGVIPYDRSLLIDTHSEIQSRPDDYLIRSPHHCLKVQPRLLLFVFTSPENSSRRDVIRATWADQFAYEPPGSVVVLFLMGAARDKKQQHLLDDESNEFGDIVQDGSFPDSPASDDRKTLSMLKWTMLHCPAARLVLRLSDDCLVLPGRLSDWLERFSSTNSWPVYSMIGEGSRCESGVGLTSLSSAGVDAEAQGCDSHSPSSNFFLSGDAVLPLVTAFYTGKSSWIPDPEHISMLSDRARLHHQPCSRCFLSGTQGRTTLMRLILFPAFHTVCGIETDQDMEKLFEWHLTDQSARLRFLSLLLILPFIAAFAHRFAKRVKHWFPGLV